MTGFQGKNSVLVEDADGFDIPMPINECVVIETCLLYTSFALLAVCLAVQACDNSKTYAEMLEEEKDAIKAFIKDSSIVVISQSEFYAQDSTTDVSKMCIRDRGK